MLLLMECEKKRTNVDLSVATDGANPVAVVAASGVQVMTEQNNGSSLATSGNH